MRDAKGGGILKGLERGHRGVGWGGGGGEHKIRCRTESFRIKL